MIFWAKRLGRVVGMARWVRITHSSVNGDGVYLEIIAIDPEGEAPQWPRWFLLITTSRRKKLQRGPQLLTWVVRTDRIDRLPQLDAYADAMLSP